MRVQSVLTVIDFTISILTNFIQNMPSGVIHVFKGCLIDLGFFAFEVIYINP